MEVVCIHFLDRIRPFTQTQRVCVATMIASARERGASGLAPLSLAISLVFCPMEAIGAWARQV